MRFCTTVLQRYIGSCDHNRYWTFIFIRSWGQLSQFQCSVGSKSGGETPTQKEQFHPEPARKRNKTAGCTARPSAMVFIDGDNYSASGNLSESPIDSEFPTFSALVCWKFFGDSAFHKKLSPQWIPMSVDLEDSIIESAKTSTRHASMVVPAHVDPAVQPSSRQLCGCQLRWTYELSVHRPETFDVNLAHSFAKHHDVISTDLNSSRFSRHEPKP